ncbi:hypothetical protein M2772_000686 [Salmonella enterica subsp. enterica serovar Bovismorbificans]|nr:hypothetical protein [Salmonella enterica]EJD8897466.1 hypothetical protein [Salmonella enterica subsp. enterica serovar Bovismorbificans]
MNNPVLRQRLLHVVDAVRNVENGEDNCVEGVHLQVEAEGVQRIVAQCDSGLKGPYHIHHRAGERQNTA